MIPTVSQVCSLGSSFEEDLDGCADAAGTAVELWLTKLEDHLQAHSVADVKARAAERGLNLAASSFQGGLLVSQADARREAWSLFERRLALCGQLGVPVLVVVPDFGGPFGHTDIERAQVSLRQAGEAAAKHGVRLALEFQSRAPFLNNLETAVMFIQSVEQPNVGICLDLFHFETGPSKTEDLSHLTRANLFHVQVCDVADRPRELASDADRILPGDGDFRLAPVFDRLRAIGYEGAVSLELLNPQFWQIPARQVAEVGLTALRKSLGVANSR